MKEKISGMRKELKENTQIKEELEEEVKNKSTISV